MSLKVFLGRAALNSPLLDGGQLQLLEKELGTTERITFTFPALEGAEGAKAALGTAAAQMYKKHARRKPGLHSA